MKWLIASSLVLLSWISMGTAEETVLARSAAELKHAGKVTAGDLPSAAQSGVRAEALKVENLEQRPKTMPQAWWTDRQAGWIGGTAGSVFGCLGGLIGALAGYGKARRFVLTVCWMLLALGLVSLIAGLAAISLRQPYAVYYPLLLLGLISSVLMGTFVVAIPRRYEQIELRRMAAMDRSDSAA